MEPMVTGASLAWYLVKLAVRIRGLDDGGDPADAMSDISELTAKLSTTGRRTWGGALKARAKTRRINAGITAAAGGAGIPTAELDAARGEAEERVRHSLARAESRILAAATTRLASLEDLKAIVATANPDLVLWLNSPTPDSVVKLYPIILDAALRELLTATQGVPTPTTRALQTALLDLSDLDRQLDRLTAVAAQVPPQVGDLATRHQRHLERIAVFDPLDFEGRDQEIAAITAFATTASGPQWWWWQADAWSGKTALMAHLTFHLPDSVEVVPFVIRRAGLPGAQNAADFAAYAVDRLADLAGFAAAPDVRGEWQRQANGIRDLLDLAAASCAFHGKTLLLLLDGLDEDAVYSQDPATRGGSIPALLPANLPQNVKVLLASRHNPGLLPEISQGSRSHPLLDGAHHHQLAVSDRARSIRDDAIRDLDELLSKSHPNNAELGRDLFGYIRASGSQLTQTELATLTGVPQWRLSPLLDTDAAARCFIPVPNHGPTKVTVYQVAHDALVDCFTEKLTGARWTEDTYAWNRYVTGALSPWRNRLREWATEHQRSGWPENTPRYLLEDHPSILDPNADLDEVLTIVTDPDWIHRILLRDTIPTIAVDHIRRILGRVGRAESTVTIRVDHQSISATYTVMAEPSDTRPARAVVLLTEALNYATSPVRHLPIEVLTSYVLLGKPELALQLAELGTPDQRVESLRTVLDTCLKCEDLHAAHRAAAAIPDDGSRAQALARIAEAAATTGNHALSETLLTLAQDTAAAITADWSRAWALARIAEAAATTGNHALSETLLTLAQDTAAAITADWSRAHGLARIAEAAATTGNWTLAQDTAAAIPTDGSRAEALARIAEAAATTGNHALSETLLTLAQDTAAAITADWSRAHGLARIAEAAATTGNWTLAQDTAAAIPTDGSRAEALARIAEAAATTGNHALSETLLTLAQDTAAAITADGSRAQVLARIAEAAATTGNWTLAQDTAAAIPADDWSRAQVLARIAEAAATTGNHALSETLLTLAQDTAAAIPADGSRAWVLARIAEAAATTGNHALSETLLTLAQDTAAAIPADWSRAEVLARIAEAAATTGNHALSETLLTLAQDTAAAIPADGSRAWVLARIAEAAATTGNWTLAQDTAAAIPADDWSRAQVLARIAEAAATTGNHALSETLLTLAQDTAAAIPADGSRAWVLARIAEAAATTGNHALSETLLTLAQDTAAAITADWSRAQVLARIAEAAATTGNWTLAQDTAAAIPTDGSRAEALARIAEAAATTGNHALSETLLTLAQDTAAAITADWSRAHGLARIAEAAATTGNHALSETLLTLAQDTAAAITADWSRAQVLARIAEAAATTGNWTLAQDTAAAIPADGSRAEVLARIAEAAATTGNHALSETLLTLAQDTAAAIPADGSRAEVLARIAEAAATTGNWSLFIRHVGGAEAVATTLFRLGLSLLRPLDIQLVARLRGVEVTSSHPRNKPAISEAYRSW